jgi:hypothetical protein
MEGLFGRGYGTLERVKSSKWIADRWIEDSCVWTETDKRETMNTDEAKAQWAPIVALGLVILIGGILAVGRLLPGNLSAGQAGRDLSTPSSRLEGRWESVDHAGFYEYYAPVDAELHTGMYRLHFPPKSPGPWIRFTVVTENRSAGRIVLRTFNKEAELASVRVGFHYRKSDVRCTISKDGQRMTQEYTFNGSSMLCVYSYAGPM